MKKMLITGGLGFIGSHLAKKYHKKYNVTLLTRSMDKIGNIRGIENDVNIVVDDIINLKHDISDYDIIIHCASTVHNYHILNNPYIDINTNCIGTVNILENMNKNARMVFVSSFFVNNGEPKALYGATKLCAEHICKAYSRVYGIDVSIIRLSNIFGPGEQKRNNKKAAFNRMIQLAIEDKEIKLYNNGNIKRDYLYIDDAVEAIDYVLLLGKPMEVYEAGKGYSLTMKEMVDDIIKYAGSGKVIPTEPPEFHKQVGIEDYFCDISKLSELGWKPKWTVREGIKKTIKEYRNEL